MDAAALRRNRSSGELSISLEVSDLWEKGQSCSTASELRALLGPALRARKAKWIRLDGLSANTLAVHDALQTSLRAFGIHGDCGEARPEIAVLEWGSVFEGAPDGLAFFPLLTRMLATAGTKVFCCMPSVGSLTSLIIRASCATVADPGVRWIPGALAKPSSIDLITGLLLLPCGKGDGISAALDSLETQMADLGCQELAGVTTGLVVELLQNIQTHSECRHAVLAAVVLKRNRPPTLQIGIADDGMGLAANLLSDVRHSWLGQFSEASIAEATLGHGISGRGAESTGGSLGGLMRTFLGETRSEVILRTGAAHVTMSSEDPMRCKKRNLTYGVGTQLLIAIRAIRT